MNEQEAIMIIQAIPEKIWNQMDKSEEEAIAMAIKSLEKQISLERIVEKLENEVEKAMRISEKAAELGKDYERHMLYHGGKGNAFEEAIEIVKEEGGIND